MFKKILMIFSLASLGLFHSGVVNANICIGKCQDKFDACRHQADLKYQKCQEDCVVNNRDNKTSVGICRHVCSVQGGQDAAKCYESNEECMNNCSKK